jgi:hypothetical protein
MQKHLRVFFILVVALFVGDAVFAQASKSSAATTTTTTTTTTTKKKATLNFEDELVEGGTQKPELFYLFQKKSFNYKRLIKLRENFLPEMRRTAEDVQRVRGAN